MYGIEGASFNALTGSLEIFNEKTPEAFVVSGTGSGIPVYRLLSRMGFGIATGVLQKNDIDYHIADSMKLTMIAGPGFEPVSNADISTAEALIVKAAFVVDAGFPAGTCNRGNIDILRSAAGVKTVFSLRPQEEIERVYGKGINLVGLSSVGQLQEQIINRKSMEALL